MIQFKDLKLTDAESLWLKAIYENGGIPEPKVFKVKLYDQLPKNFDYTNLHRAFLWDNRLNILGIWLVNPKDETFENVDKVIKAIRAEILKNPKIENITAQKVSELTGISVQNSKEALGRLGTFGGYWSSASNTGTDFGYETIGFSGDGHIDVYLNYQDLPTLLEEIWKKYRLDLYIRPESAPQPQGKTQLCFTKLGHTVIFGKEKWMFHSNAAQVVRILIRAVQQGIPQVHIEEIHSSLPKEIQSQSLSQIFKKREKDAAWKKLVIPGSGKGFWQINPQYLENGVREIDLTENPAENS